jgi:hypothetical protein
MGPDNQGASPGDFSPIPDGEVVRKGEFTKTKESIKAGY